METMIEIKHNNLKKKISIIIGANNTKSVELVYNILNKLFVTDNRNCILFSAMGLEENLIELKEVLRQENYTYNSIKKKFFTKKYYQLEYMTDNIKICKKLLLQWTNVIYEERKIVIYKSQSYNKEYTLNFSENIDINNVICTISSIGDFDYDFSYELTFSDEFYNIIKDETIAYISDINDYDN